MAEPPTGIDTCWTLIARVAQGDSAGCSMFSRLYLPVVRSYLAGRWAASPLRAQLDDAVQEVFLECYREQGALDSADPERGGFRRYLLGVVRNVARRFEKRARRAHERREPGSFHPELLPADDERPSRDFDRGFALAIMGQALAALERRAVDDAARRRFELLRLRFVDDLPIRAIAERFGEDTERVHGAYRRARREFHACLRDVVAFHHPGGADLDQECKELLWLLG